MPAIFNSFKIITALIVYASTYSYAATITTATGENGADTYTEGNSNTNNRGSLGSLQAKNAGAYRQIYLRFDLSSITGPITSATLQLTLSGATWNSTVDEANGLTFNIYGLNDGLAAGSRLGENWAEDAITGANAPTILDTASSGAVLAGSQPAVLLGTIVIPYATTSGTTVSLSGEALSNLVNFLNADTNDMVTFVITRATGNTNNTLTFYSKESTAGESAYPTLIVNVNEIPEAATLMLMPAGIAALMMRRQKMKKR